MIKQQKPLTIIAIAILVVALFGIWYFFGLRDEDNEGADQTQTETTQRADGVESSGQSGGVNPQDEIISGPDTDEDGIPEVDPDPEVDDRGGGQP